MNAKQYAETKQQKNRAKKYRKWYFPKNLYDFPRNFLLFFLIVCVSINLKYQWGHWVRYVATTRDSVAHCICITLNRMSFSILIFVHQMNFLFRICVSGSLMLLTWMIHVTIASTVLRCSTEWGKLQTTANEILRNRHFVVVAFVENKEKPWDKLREEENLNTEWGKMRSKLSLDEKIFSAFCLFLCSSQIFLFVFSIYFACHLLMRLLRAT